MSDDVERAVTKGDPIIQYCAICGVEFDARILSNRWFKCDSCDSILQVRARTEHELGIEN